MAAGFLEQTGRSHVFKPLNVCYLRQGTRTLTARRVRNLPTQISSATVRRCGINALAAMERAQYKKTHGVFQDRMEITLGTAEVGPGPNRLKPWFLRQLSRLFSSIQPALQLH